MARPKKLWKTTDKDCQLVLYAHSTGVQFQQFSGVRVLFWPNLIPCWAANMYLVTNLRYGRAIGTVNTYAAELTCFLRFLSTNNILFEDMSDNAMHEFSDFLARETDWRSSQASRRGGRQVNKILRRALVFLKWYQSIFSVDNPIVGVADSTAKINIEDRAFRVKNRTVTYIWHTSMVPNDVPLDIKPLSRSIYLELLDACKNIAKSPYVQARTRTLLKMLSDTGARRVEISQVKVTDVIEAVESGHGMLRLFTAKRGDKRQRLVPVPSVTLNAVLSFIEVKRKLHISRLLKRKVILQDAGWLFLTDRGQQLNVETITQDVARLRRIAGINEKATAHMLRHRWITIQVLERLKAYIGQKLPMDIATTILTKVASMTGHKQIESLWTYIDLAFEELGIWDTAESVINMRMNAEAAHRELSEIRNQHSDGKSLTKCELKRVDELLQNLLEHVKPEFTKSSKDKDFRMTIDTHSLRK